MREFIERVAPGPGGPCTRRRTIPERNERKTLVARDDGDDADGVVIKVHADETNDVISIIEQPFGPGLLLPPHMHQNDVWLYILEGEMHARVGDEVVVANPGSWVLKPRGIPHTMWNAGPSRHAWVSRMASASSTTGFRSSRRPTTCASSVSRSILILA